MPITFAEISKFDNGAQFYAADLHVHSYGASADVSDNSMTVEAIVDQSIKQGIAVLCITDHNTAGHVERSIDYGRKYAGQLLVLAGVEITTAHGHLLVYFSPENATVVQDLLSRIRVVGKPGARDSHTTMSMADTVREAEQLGGVCIAAHVDRAGTGFEAREDGYPHWKSDIVTSSGLYGMEFDAADHLGWYSPEEPAAGAGGERKKLLMARSRSSATAARMRLAAVQNSDAHTLAEFAQQDSRRSLTKLKMNELTFEGFRTALVDAEARVRPEVVIPPSIPRIRGVHFIGGFLNGETYHFSNNLNCFIGGRGTGKSTAIRGLAYGLGLDEEFGEYDNCPDTVIVYCEDANGVLYRYEREKGLPASVRAREEGTVHDVTADAFHIEFYRQGSLAEVAKDPLRNPALLQEFLDTHLVLADLRQREADLLEELAQNSALLKPLEAAAAQLPTKETALAGLNSKLKAAETGKVKEIAAYQIRLGAERNLVKSLGDVRAVYVRGLSLANWLRDYNALVQAAGTLTGDAATAEALEEARKVIQQANAFVQKQETSINERLRELGRDLETALARVRQRHTQMDEAVVAAIQKLRAQGLSGSVNELNALIKQQATVSTDVARIKGQMAQLTELRQERETLLASLSTVRAEIAERRAAQVAKINDNVSRTIRDFVVVLYYDASGVVDEFVALVLEVMQGTYLPQETAEKLCANIAPTDFARLVRTDDVAALAQVGGIGNRWATDLISRFAIIENRHRVEIIAKPPRPIIKVLTRTRPQRQLTVAQLSDGQKHTILLTIAMLAESNVPLVIDQPEDDLDNAFIFASVVSTLRGIKETRQLIVVTHNANISVLGDSELILPMKRSGDQGMVYERGSIDRMETCAVVQEILEGGRLAFERRREIYGH